jgi:hypothetical protein
VFEEFLASLLAAGVSEEVVGRLRKVLVEEGKYTENALKPAIFGE